MSNGDVTFSGYSFPLCFLERGIIKEDNFSGAGFQDMSKGDILLDWAII